MTDGPDSGSRYRQAIGQTIAAYRTQHGFSLRALADLSGISLAYLSELEHGRKEPSGAMLDQLARAYRVALPELLRAIAERLETDDAAPGVALDGLDPDDIRELGHFADWLRWRKTQE